MHPKNSHARYASFAAQKLGWDLKILDGGDGYLFEIHDGARSRVLSCATGSPYTENSAAAYSIARDKEFTALALLRADVPHIPGNMYFLSENGSEWRALGRELTDLYREAPQRGWPIFCKPVSGCRGVFARQINDMHSLSRYVEEVVAHHSAILVQSVITDAECRVFVYRGEAIFWYEKFDFSTGSGARPRNRSQGGVSGEPSTVIPSDLKKCAIAATAALGLNLAGVDLFYGPSGPRVLEINANPMIETLELWGRWDLIERIWVGNLKSVMA